MRPSTSFLLGVVVGVMAVVVADRARKMFREEDVEALKDRISEGLRGLEKTVGTLTDGLTETLAKAAD